jgi:FkbH-like protein
VIDRATPSIARLARSDLELGEVTHLVTELEKAHTFERTVIFGLSGNVTLDLLGTFLRKQALLHGHHAEVLGGNFDDHLGNVTRFAAAGVDAVILVNLFDALLPAFEARLPLLGREVVNAQAERVGSELGLALAAARTIKHVFLPLFHRLTMPALFESEVGLAIAAFNDVVLSEAARHDNVHLLDSAALAAALGFTKAHDLRSYHRFRAPFAPPYLDRLAEQVYRSCRGFGSYFYKALVLDGDNTLWGGVLGEDLASGIKLGPHGYPGSVYWQIQHELLALQQRGVLLCLSSKNEPGEIDELLAAHPDMVLRDQHFAVKRVNWEDKVENLQRIAADLAIGLDSLVFVDDSPFECEAIRSQLPAVKTFQVPEQVSEYPRLIADIKDLFAPSKISAESAGKTEHYRSRALTQGGRAEFATQEQYLASLGLKVTVYRDRRASLARVAELTQKSNQWNLTTRRYTDVEIRSFMESDQAEVYSIHVADKFGDSGLTGVVIVRYCEPQVATLDTFLLSCRILGRGVETSFWDGIFERVRERGCRALFAEYLPTAKNAQVRDFWDRLGLELASQRGDGHRQYRCPLSRLPRLCPSHVEVHHVF